MVDLHRHDEYSTFDGFGKAKELAKLAKEKGYTALGTSNHGNTNGIVKTWEACLAEGIKPILGIEGYFLPKYKPQTRGYHLCLFAMTKKGYNNINRIQYEGEKQKYYNSIWDFKILSKHTEDVICTSACVAGYSAQCIKANQIDKARRYFKKMKELFGENFYIEIQPYVVSEKGLQEKVNLESMKLASELGIKCILTSDSHRGKKEDFPTYLKMHEIAEHNSMDIEGTYRERYMPDLHEMAKRFYKMHKKDFGPEKAKKLAKQMERNLEELESKVEMNIFEDNKMTLPQFCETEEESNELLEEKVKKGLKFRGKNKDKKYIKRCKQELDVIKSLGFASYFLMVADYTQWAKSRGIVVGPGRGSGCNSEVCYALRITEVDSLKYNLDFRRFLRKDKKKMPDIDLDFETDRRAEVIEYLCEKYEGHAAQICSYGMYKVDNIINDLSKKCGLPIDKSQGESVIRQNKATIDEIKKFINEFISDGELDEEKLRTDKRFKRYNELYDDIVEHFTKLFMKVRYIGTHAAGVAITGDDIFDYTTLRIDQKTGKKYVSFDLDDLDKIKVTKFDILGLRTMSELGVLRKVTGNDFDDSITEDKKIMEHFKEADTDGIFQFEKSQVKAMLRNIECDCFEDVIAINSMNRPGPLSLGQPDLYAENKKNKDHIEKNAYYEYTKETYGTLIYQEQIQQICVNMAGMEWNDADAVMKMMKSNVGSREARRIEEESGALRQKFLEGAKKNGIDVNEAMDTYDKLLTYSFNKGHGAGYSLISVEEMFYKVYYPTEFWFAKMMFALNDSELEKFASFAVKNNSVVFLPHVNYSKELTSLRKVDGENCIQKGLADLKGIGKKAASYIYEERKKNGIFRSYDDFYDRCKSRVVTSRVIAILKEQGALEFNKKTYLKRVVKYDSTLMSKTFR